MPIFGFSKASDGKAPRSAEAPRKNGGERIERLREKLRNARKLVREQRKTLKSKDREIKELAENLTVARRFGEERRKEVWRQRSEIFQLNNELAAIRGLVKNAENGPLAPHASGAPEVGRLPDFVVIGAQKCGTSFFYALLTRHPNVERAAVKEVHYFSKQENFRKGIEWYRRSFPTPRWEGGQRTITGEATPMYLTSHSAPARMAEVMPEARLIVLLRNPVDRAYSAYHHAIRGGIETRSFEEAIEEERARLLDGENKPPEHAPPSRSDVDRSGSVSYLRRSIYVDQLLRWRKFFGDEQMLVLKSEDFFERPQDSLKLVLEYLDLPYWEPELQSRKAKREYEPMDPATRQRLEEYFEPHNRRLYDHLGVDLGW